MVSCDPSRDQVAGGGHTRNVSYPYFKGFNQFLGNLDILQKVVTVATRNTGSATHSESILCPNPPLTISPIRPAAERSKAVWTGHSTAGGTPLPAV